MKDAFRQHLERLGFVMDQPWETVLQELGRHMGPQRYAEYQRIVGAGHQGEESENRLYDFVQDMREANLLDCLRPNVTLDTSYHLYEKALPHLTAGRRVIELGCWTGGLSSFLAENHADCHVTGVDRARRIIELDRSHYCLPNLQFTLWDYREAKPNELQPADLLLCGLGTNNDCPRGINANCDPLRVRESEGYKRGRYEAVRYFRNWRQVARDGALLLAVLRITTFPRFLSFIDAAQEAGWTPLVDQFSFVACPTNKESIPSMPFAARPCEPVSEDAVLSQWMQTWSGQQPLAVFSGPVALGVYRALGPKQVLAQREVRNDAGFVGREELGICGPCGYIYGQSARPDHRLMLISIAQAESQRQFVDRFKVS